MLLSAELIDMNTCCKSVCKALCEREITGMLQEDSAALLTCLHVSGSIQHISASLLKIYNERNGMNEGVHGFIRGENELT